VASVVEGFSDVQDHWVVASVVLGFSDVQDHWVVRSVVRGLEAVTLTPVIELSILAGGPEVSSQSTSFSQLQVCIFWSHTRGLLQLNFW